MKEMIERLIAENYREFSVKGSMVTLYKTIDGIVGCHTVEIPRCIFGDICECSRTFLKTLLVDDEEESEAEEQKRIKDLIEHGFVYIINVIDGNIFCVGGDDKYFIFGAADKGIFSKHCSEVYEKVYLKDLIKKRKVKKSAWFAVDRGGSKYIYDGKPLRGIENWAGAIGSKVIDLDFLDGLNITWEDEPLELTYEVEE